MKDDKQKRRQQLQGNESKGEADEKHYTYMVTVSFDMQFTFTESEVEQAEEGGEGDVDPTEKALADLENELEECLGFNYSVDKIEAWADFDSLLGINGVPAKQGTTGKSVRKII